MTTEVLRLGILLWTLKLGLLTPAFHKITDIKFQRFPWEPSCEGSQLATVAGRSPLDCVSQCSQKARCEAIGVCLSDGLKKVFCSFLEDHGMAECNISTSVASLSCFLMKKVSTGEPDLATIPSSAETTTQSRETTQGEPETMIVCQNNGEANGTRCACPIQYSGRFCQRYIRDCSDAAQNGHENPEQNGPYLIQPIGSSQPFYVWCNFEYGGVTVPFHRLSSPFNPSSWTSARDGFGKVNTESIPFFIGLENLHQLTSQNKYNNHILVMYNEWEDMGSSYYNNFIVGPELSAYALSYSSFFSYEDRQADNGLNATGPMSFCTQDRDNAQKCATIRGAPGWYGADCKGYSIFADELKWPVSGSDVNVDGMGWSMVQTVPYDD